MSATTQWYGTSAPVEAPKQPTLNEIAEVNAKKAVENLSGLVVFKGENIPRQFIAGLNKLNRKDRRVWLKKNRKLWS